MKKSITYCYSALFFLLISVSFSFAQSKAEKQKISSRYDQTKLSQLQSEFAAKRQAAKQEALQMASQKGWEVLRPKPDGSFDELVAVSSDGTPIYLTLFNVNAAKSTRANHLNIGGSLGLSLDGQNMTAHVWDGGPTRVTHQEFDGAGGSNRVTINDGVTAINGNSFHAQHVTGTIVASGFQAAAKGMAPRASALTHEWNNDLSEATAEAAAGMLISNHSYGFRADLVPDWYFGAYIGESRDWDNLMYNSPYYLMVVAGGNDGNDNSSNGAPLNGNSSYDKLTGHSTSKNNMVVANGQDANVSTDGTLVSVSINSGSSEGPTDDLRVKPDITGNGTSVYSTYSSANNAYGTISGTSMASPNVAGTLLLLQQHAFNVNGGFMRAATLKGLALHTADDAGLAGPDAVFGWGLLNAKEAARVITDNGSTSKVEELTLTAGQTYSITVDADGINPLLASISWTDPAGTANTGIANLTTPVLVNDLDIRVTKGASTFTPYRLTGVNSNTNADNTVDPYERIDIAGAVGTYTITVTHKGSLSGGSQNFSLIVTGIDATPTVCTASVPTGLGTSAVGSSTATLSWGAVSGATYDLRYRPSGATTWTTVVANETTTTLTGLVSATSYEAQVRSECSDGSNSAYSSSVNFITTSVAVSCNATVGGSYSEGFESGVGAWTQATGDDFDWTRRSGGTPSSNTGPSAAAQGSFYMYMEASNPNYPSKSTIIESPCFDLSGETAANFTFQYHMYGASGMGGLTLEASVDGTTWSSVWSRSGNQGNSWLSAEVDLSSYVGGIVKLRFTGTTNSTWQGDIAVDNIAMSSGVSSSTDVTLNLTFDNYPEETSWEIKDGSTVVASGGTYGSQPDGSSLAVNLTLNDGCYDLVVYDTYGDGMCCTYGSGSYQLSAGSTVLASGGSFASSATTNFCVGTSVNSYSILSNVAVSEGQLVGGLGVYPNPAENVLTIFTGKMNDADYSIVNASGKIWKLGTISGNQAKIDIADLSKGFYFVKITDGQNVVIEKLVKQ